MFEIILAIGIAALGIFFFTTAFSQTSTGSAATAASAKKSHAPKNSNSSNNNTATAAAAPAKKEQKKVKKTKKQIAEEKREEAEIERLIAAQGSSVSGMPTDKAKVVSLDEAAPKQQKAKKASGNRAAPQVTTKQRIIDQEAGFSYVEKKTKSASPVLNDRAAGRPDMDRELTKFFKQADRRGKEKDRSYGPKKDDDGKKATGTVTMKKKITSDPTDLWAQGRTWE